MDEVLEIDGVDRRMVTVVEVAEIVNCDPEEMTLSI